MPVQKLSGKASYLTYKGTRLSITKVTPKFTRGMADTTASDNYDVTSDLLWKSQIAVTGSMELSVEGRFDLNSTNSVILADLASGVAAQPVVLGLNATTVFGHGNFDISEFTADEPVDDTVNFTATLMSNGVFTFGS
jgi:predicted secreted protein